MEKGKEWGVWGVWRLAGGFFSLECELWRYICGGGEGRGGEGRGVLGLNKNTIEKRERRFLTLMKMILSATDLNAM